MEIKNKINKKLNLENLHSCELSLPKGKAGMLMEACVWCLLQCDHPNGVKIQSVHCENEIYYYNVCWPEDRIDIDAIFRTYNKDDSIEHGAEAITFLLVLAQTSYTAIRRAATGTGIDYWLGFKSKDPDNIFSKDGARLEISGILEEKGNNTINRRIKEKMKQTKPTDHTFPVFISVIEFSRPYAEMVIKNANS